MCRVAAHRVINDAKQPDLISRFTKSCGFGMGLEFREGAYVINDKNQKTMAKGQKKGGRMCDGPWVGVIAAAKCCRGWTSN